MARMFAHCAEARSRSITYFVLEMYEIGRYAKVK